VRDISEDRRDPYARIHTAIAYVLGVMCGACRTVPLKDKTSWQCMIEWGWTPDRVVAFIKDECDKLGDEGNFAQARAQMDLPEFRTYILGKMGAC
jgi:hypothetical protein